MKKLRKACVLIKMHVAPVQMCPLFLTDFYLLMFFLLLFICRYKQI